jgi:hypothetical protein
VAVVENLIPCRIPWISASTRAGAGNSHRVPN